MYINYLKIAFRNLLKKKVYTIINVLGLSVGAAAIVTISYQAINAARVNPVDSLKDE